jgi:hypothetical protein
MTVHTCSRREGKTSNLKHSRILIAAGEDVRANGFWGETPLHHAPDEHIARVPISHGAAVHAVTNSGPRTLLHSAQALGLAQALISHSADASAVDNSGRSTASRFSKRTEVYISSHRQSATHWFLF